MTKYKVGDTIVMTEGANRVYSLSTEGSEGVITEVYLHGTYQVKFYYLNGGGDTESFIVESKYFKLLKPAVVLSHAEVLENKIKLMWGRQKYAKSQQVMV